MRALIVSSDRFEDSELAEPRQQLLAKGVEVDIAAPQQRLITGKHGHRVSADLTLSAVRPEDYDLLLLPGGEAPASLRNLPEAVAIAQHFLRADKPVAAICHGPQLLIATGLMAGRTATCYRAVRRELEAAGANYLDREVVVDGNLVTSRRPADLPAFIQAIFTITRLSR
ncbi:type 1 glutamine amidotransferase [Bradyrhizobium sediminis]|uniref:Type 1 glutamine amidotransferase n=1 Tax=Bradyrhizobium sediminis TaxID=2840469 RepID=A0A975RMV6_9BRAD|nr:type 1 glutamine amidotransferase domain-containing protein [Bradyrhizobium sediminis]QWG13154.1 type 1 glutamine amidotransferase [Bradyrhizobium sediminis]QWG22186.1 type 1 glutamine amidotransferase [Bradyrhizobium sediminis]